MIDPANITARLRASHNEILLISGIVGFILIPWLPARFFALCLAIRGLLGMPYIHAPLLLLYSALLYCFAFLLNPIAYYLGTPPMELTSPLLFRGIQIALIGFAAPWLYLIMRHTRNISCATPRFSCIIPWTILFLLLFLPSWYVDPAYGGDETYHITTLRLYRHFLHNISIQSWTWILGAMWTITATVTLYTQIRNHPHKRRYQTILLLMTLLCAAMMPLSYSDIWLHSKFSRERAMRYPTAQAWISTLLATSCRSNWQNRIFPHELARLLPPLALWGLGIMITQRLKKQVWYVATATAVACATLPNFLYHGTILYLELPAVFLLTLVLIDVGHIISSPAGELGNRYSWWALIYLGFSKETVVPPLLLLMALRSVYQLKQCKSERWRKTLEEIAVGFVILGPALLYLALRSVDNQRPYGAQWQNLLNIKLWFESLMPLLHQAGPILVLAALGLGYILYSKEYIKAITYILMLLGIKAFFVVDSTNWLGLARFNLLVIPVFLAAAIPGIEMILKRRKVNSAMALCALILCGNLYLSPVDIQGNRENWGERWFPYNRALQQIYRDFPNRPIMLSNMELPYAVDLVTEQHNWKPYLKQLPPQMQNPEKNLEFSLRCAKKYNFAVVLHLDPDNLKLSPDYRCHGFVKRQEFQSKHGSLLLFYRDHQ